MIKKITLYLTGLLMMLTLLAPMAAGISPLMQFGAKCPNNPILTFPSWYKNLECDIQTKPPKIQPKITDLNDFWVIALNIVEMLIGAAAYIAVGFIMWGGFKYIKSRGEPGKIAEAKLAITQAVIGLGIALMSTAIVIFVGEVIS